MPNKWKVSFVLIDNFESIIDSFDKEGNEEEVYPYNIEEIRKQLSFDLCAGLSIENNKIELEKIETN
jgi:hypothetical protein